MSNVWKTFCVRFLNLPSRVKVSCKAWLVIFRIGIARMEMEIEAYCCFPLAG